MTLDFQRKKENFICERCDAEVFGDGYTNHCPHCLWSKHVDINPGDRASLCGGLMKPLSFESHDGGYRVIHECIVCGHQKPNKLEKNDIFEPEQLL